MSTPDRSHHFVGFFAQKYNSETSNSYLVLSLFARALMKERQADTNKEFLVQVDLCKEQELART